jgi:transposase-like protein
MTKSDYSTAEVAKAVGVNKQTLLRWLWAGKLPEPRRVTFGGVESRVWTAKELKQAREHKELRYRKKS